MAPERSARLLDGLRKASGLSACSTAEPLSSTSVSPKASPALKPRRRSLPCFKAGAASTVPSGDVPELDAEEMKLAIRTLYHVSERREEAPSESRGLHCFRSRLWRRRSETAAPPQCSPGASSVASSFPRRMAGGPKPSLQSCSAQSTFSDGLQDAHAMETAVEFDLSHKKATFTTLRDLKRSSKLAVVSQRLAEPKELTHV